ncbi:MAG TPA: dockerin type I repeat-containing protein [Phycisphaerae bacterium]|nr:dockerin type I repeat-containing protein [Phycisphaerae bacterium]
MHVRFISTIWVFVALSAGTSRAEPQYSWRYYRPGNTGIQGDFNEALWIAPDGDPYIGGYDPSFEEGGFAKFIQAENRWVNYSNVDYPIIGHPDDTGCTRARDIVPEMGGRLWIGTWRGALSFDPTVGATSLMRHGPGNSGLSADFVWDIDRAPDGTMWFANNGSARYDPATNTWTRWDNMGNVFIAAQPKPTGGYLIWSSSRAPTRDYTFVFDSDTEQWTIISVAYPFDKPNEVVGMPGKDCVDETGNFWALRSTSPGDFDSLDYRQPDGFWVTPPEPFYGVTFDIWAFKAYGDRRALLVDGNGTVWQFDGSTWGNLGQWRPGAYTYSADIDAAGNVWVCGSGGAARRNAQTGQWQRYRITNTANFDSFNRDLAIDPVNNYVYTGANAGSGIGGMVRFDGTRWTAWNQLTYGIGYDWPFPNDYCETLAYQPSNGRIAVSPLEWLYGIHEWTGSGFNPLLPSGGAVRMCEDSQGRLWALGEYYSLSYLDTRGWNSVPIIAWGSKIQRDPERPGTVWAATGHEIVRTDGVYRFSRNIEEFPELPASSATFSGLAAAPGGIAWIGAWVQFSDGTGSALIRIDSNVGTYQMLRFEEGWPLPGQAVQPLAVTPDGRLWMQYDSDYLTAQRGLCWYDGTNVGVFPAPPGGEPQWGGLPHAAIDDLEVRVIPGGYELWMSCVSRGLAVLTVLNTVPAPGDINGDGVVNDADLTIFVAVLLGVDKNPTHLARSDLTGDGTANGADAQIFVHQMLMP